MYTVCCILGKEKEDIVIVLVIYSCLLFAFESKLIFICLFAVRF